MFIIDDVLVSEELLSEQFVCDLSKCKGGCCVEGDCGAPITQEEAHAIEDAYPVFRDLLPARAQQLVEEEGTYTFDEEFGLVTPVMEEGICAFGFYDESGIVKCAIEQKFREGKLEFNKPVSCHLFPIRVTEKGDFIALNYEPRPGLCKPACKLGKSLKVPVYTFLKEPIIRRFGTAFYEALDATAREYYNSEKA